jgi:DNA ligase D-like protein (predicted 3'-phosphoesterase)
MSSQESLREYRAKRDFDRTAEPSDGGRRPSTEPIFVIQKHGARSLHYDFRLEVEGVLKSWAAPKGPSTDSRDRRLAMPTEDHPLEYALFEGIIPVGEYRAGTVLVWDRGTYRNLRGEKEDESKRLSMLESIRDGQLKVWLEGQKLRGGYALIRTGAGKDERRLLIKVKDEEADARRKPTVTEPQSVISGHTLREIAEGKGRDD